RVFIISLVVAIPGLFYPLMPSPWLAFGVAAIGYFCSGMAGAAENAALQTVTPTELRGKVTALFLFIYYVVGVALSPILNALITDYVLRNEALIRWAIFWHSIICRPLSLVIAWFGLRPYGREVARLASLER
ncbi:MAG: hypothetical protein ACRET2_18585, partial [Steroidobacteraceae bacterium]